VLSSFNLHLKLLQHEATFLLDKRCFEWPVFCCGWQDEFQQLLPISCMTARKKGIPICAVFGINVYGTAAKQGFIKNVNIYA